MQHNLATEALEAGKRNFAVLTLQLAILISRANFAYMRSVRNELATESLGPRKLSFAVLMLQKDILMSTTNSARMRTVQQTLVITELDMLPNTVSNIRLQIC